MDVPVIFRVTLRYPEHADLKRREPHDIYVLAPNSEIAAKKAAVFGRRKWRGGLRWEAEILSVSKVENYDVSREDILSQMSRPLDL